MLLYDLLAKRSGSRMFRVKSSSEGGGMITNTLCHAFFKLLVCVCALRSTVGRLFRFLFVADPFAEAGDGKPSFLPADAQIA